MTRPDAESRSRQRLESARLYRTGSRVSILEVLTEADRPLSQEDIARRLGENRLNRVTIYRVLGSFIEAGLVRRAFVQERAWHFELADERGEHPCHPHFTCEDCGRTDCLPDVSVPTIQGVRRGFVVHRQQVRFEGLCPRCAARTDRGSYMPDANPQTDEGDASPALTTLDERRTP